MLDVLKKKKKKQLEKEVKSIMTNFADDTLILNSYDEDWAGGTAKRHDGTQRWGI